MASFGDFSSLLQLGVGTGIGLSLFRAPVDLRVKFLSKVIEEELASLNNSSSQFGRKKRRDISDLKQKFLEVCDKLDIYMQPFMVAAVVGAALNLIALIDRTLNSDIELSNVAIWWLLFVSVGFFILELALLEVLARRCLGPIANELAVIRRRRDIGSPSLG